MLILSLYEKSKHFCYYLVMGNLNRMPKLIFFLCIFHLIVNLLWLSLNNSPLPWDQAGHTRTAIQFSDFFKSFGFLKIVNYFSLSNYYPPLIHTMVAFLIIFFGHPIFMGGFVITLFFITSIFLVYQYTKELINSKQVGIFAAIIYSFFPIIFEHSRWFLLEIPLLTFILASLVYLNRSENFTKPKSTFKFFIFATLSVLTKWLSLIYLFIPLAFAFYKFLKTPNKEAKAKNAIVNGIGFFIVFTLPWYLINLSSLLHSVPPNLKGEQSDPSILFSLKNIFFYLYLFINFQTTLYFGLLFLIASIYYFLKKKQKRGLIFSFILFNYAIFTIIPNKDWRYTIPLLPFVALIISSFVFDVYKKIRLLGMFMIALLLIIQIAYFMLLSFRFPLNFTYQKAVNLPLIGWVDYININDNLAHSYNNYNWKQKEILNFIEKDRKKDSKNTAWLLVLVDKERINSGNLLLQRDLDRLSNIEVESPPNDPLVNNQEIQNYLYKFNYVLVGENEIETLATRNLNVFYQISNFVISNYPNSYDRSAEFYLPSKETLRLYKLKNYEKNN